MKRYRRKPENESGEFLWLISLSDLMILLFIFFVVMFSFTYKKLKATDVQRIVATLKNEKPPETPTDKIEKKLSQWVEEEKLSQQVSVTKKDDTVELQIRDQLFFSSGKYDIRPEGLGALSSLAKTLEKVPAPLRIGIEGHTDDIPISNKEIADNWELSAKRSMAVLRALKLSPELLKRTSAIAQGDVQPLVPNRDAAGIPQPSNQAKNRRVTIRIY